MTHRVVAVPEQADPAICIVYPEEGAYTETFIRAHVERLPAKVKVLYGGISQGALPQCTGDGQSLFVPMGLPRRLLRGVRRRVLQLPGDCFQRAAISQYLSQNGVDAVLAEYGPTGVVMMDICRRARIPLVVHFHGYDAYKRSALEGAGLHYPQLFQCAEAIIAVSHDMESQLRRLGAPPEKVHYNPYGVDTSRFGQANPAGAPPLFLAVGRFVDKKAPYLTLLAFSRVFERVPEARLVMVGDGPLWEACQRLALALGLGTSVSFPGPCSHDAVANLMRQARVFVQHSLHSYSGDAEGTPVAVLEAGAAGLPVIATRHGGIRDVVVEDETGWLVDEGDVDSMARAMLRLAVDPVLAGRQGTAAQKRIYSGFTMEKSIRGLWGIIVTVMQSYRERGSAPRRHF